MATSNSTPIYTTLTDVTGHLAEFGKVAGQGSKGLWGLGARVFGEDTEDAPLPLPARIALGALVNQIRHLETAIKRIEAELLAWHRTRWPLSTMANLGRVTSVKVV